MFATQVTGVLCHQSCLYTSSLLSIITAVGTYSDVRAPLSLYQGGRTLTPSLLLLCSSGKERGGNSTTIQHESILRIPAYFCQQVEAISYKDIHNQHHKYQIIKQHTLSNDLASQITSCHAIITNVKTCSCAF